MWLHKLLKKKQGFTMAEIMVTVGILGIIVSIAIPNMARARQDSRANICMNNLRIIDEAKGMAIVIDGLDGSSVDIFDIEPYIDGAVANSSTGYLDGVECPEVGTWYYGINGANAFPHCSAYDSSTHPAELS